MDALEALMTTRALRRFTDEPVADADVITCLEAAQQAPSGGNVQAQRYLVLTDPDRRALVGGYYRRAYDRYEASLPEAQFTDPADAASWTRTAAASRHLADHLGEVPVLVLFLLPRIPWAPEDDQGPMDIGPLYASAYPAVQSFCVAARALGLGTALTTVIRIHGDETLAALGVDRPERWEITALVPLGHPEGNFGRARRRPVARVASWNTWKTPPPVVGAGGGAG